VFLDDDCYLESPRRLTAALQLMGTKVDGKEIVAISGLYKDLSRRQEGKRCYSDLSPTSVLTGMNAFLERSFLTAQHERLTLMPYHTLGGALVLSEKVFKSLPFDPFIPRGEDHAYCIDLKGRCAGNLVVLRDNFFVIQHARQPETSQTIHRLNTIRDIFRFVYLRFKTGEWYIPHFTIRWTINALVQALLDAPRNKHRILELWAVLLSARNYARRNARGYFEAEKAWKILLRKTG
jgi:hypothetical protein